MIIHIEKNGISCSIHQTLNGFLLRTSFDPLANIPFLEAMEKHFHVTGAENINNCGRNAVTFVGREYRSENILDTITEILEETCFQ